MKAKNGQRDRVNRLLSFRQLGGSQGWLSRPIPLLARTFYILCDARHQVNHFPLLIFAYKAYMKMALSKSRKNRIVGSNEFYEFRQRPAFNLFWKIGPRYVRDTFFRPGISRGATAFNSLGF